MEDAASGVYVKFCQAIIVLEVFSVFASKLSVVEASGRGLRDGTVMGVYASVKR